MRHARENPPQPLIDKLLYARDICLIHGIEECFKSIFVLQMAESLALGRPLLGLWTVPRNRRVGVIETEMHPAQIGERLARMFPTGQAPEEMRFLPESALKQWRRKKMDGKFKLIDTWVTNEGIDILMIDTANDFFRGTDDPNKESTVGGVFDELRNLSREAAVLVRHDKKHRLEDDGSSSNEKIRGSAEFKEDPELILYLRREDKRTNEARFEVGKLRYGSKPEPQTLWFDAGTFRLTPLPPVITMLEDGPKSRAELVREGKERFGMCHSLVDGMVKELGQYLSQSQRGHEKVFEIDTEPAAEAPWGWLLGERVEDIEDSISCTPAPSGLSREELPPLGSIQASCSADNQVTPSGLWGLECESGHSLESSSPNL
jgi:hypothetical protein